jgi:S1-C subfamily serine protease/WD40 repeat protein
MAELIELPCPHCGRVGTTSKTLEAGARVRCKGCGTIFDFRPVETERPAPAAIASLGGRVRNLAIVATVLGAVAVAAILIVASARRRDGAPPVVAGRAVATPAKPPDAADLRLIERVGKSLALIEVVLNKPSGPNGGKRTGSAFCLGRRQWFVTAADVVSEVSARRGEIRLVLGDRNSGRRIYYPTVASVDQELGLALLDIEDDGDSEVVPIGLGDDSPLREGATLDAVGYPPGSFVLPADAQDRQRPNSPKFSFNYKGTSENYEYAYPNLLARRGRVVIRASKVDDRVEWVGLRLDEDTVSLAVGTPCFGTDGRVAAVYAPGIGNALGVSRVARFLAAASSPDGRKPAAGEEALTVVDLGAKATAKVEVAFAHPARKAVGSAFCVGRSGLFVTNAHVVRDEHYPVSAVRLVLESGQPSQRSVPAEVLRRDDKLDLALLKTTRDERLQPLALARDSEVFPTKPVRSFGFPFAAPSVVIHSNRVTSVIEDERTREVRQILLDGQFNPGNSGGPVLDAKGRVVGVAVATISGAQMNFVIPVGRVNAFLHRTGLRIEPAELAWATRGAKTTWKVKVVPPTPDDTLPGDLTVAATISDGVATPRTVWAEPTADPDTFQFPFVPVPRDPVRIVRIAVQSGETVENMDVDDVSLKIRGQEHLLSDLYHVSPRPEPWAYTARGELIVGPFDGLGPVRAEVSAGHRRVVRTVDLGRARGISVLVVFGAPALNRLSITVEARHGGRTGAVIASLTESYPIRGAIPPARDIRNNEGYYETRTKVNRPDASINPFEGDKRELARSVAVGEALRVHGQALGSAQALPPFAGEIGAARLIASEGPDLGLHRIPVPGGFPSSISALSEDDSLLAVATKRSVLVYELPKGLQVCELAQVEAISLTFARAARRLWTYSKKDGLVLWDLHTARRVETGYPNLAGRNMFRIHPDGRRIMAADSNRQLTVLDAETGETIRTFHKLYFHENTFPNDWSRVPMVFEVPGTPRPSRRYRIYDVESGEIHSEGELPTFQELALSVGPRRRNLAVGWDRSGREVPPDEQGLVRDLATGVEHHGFGAAEARGVVPSGLGIVVAERALSSAHNASVLRLLDLDTVHELGRVRLPEIHPNSRWAFSPSGRLLGIASDQEYWLWDLPRHKADVAAGPENPGRDEAAPRMCPLGGKVRDLAIGGGGRYLVMALAKRPRIAIFDCTTGSITKTIDLTSEKTLIAAGAKRFVIATPLGEDRTRWEVETWDFATLSREGGPKLWPIPGILHALSLGADSDGPLLACWSIKPKVPVPATQPFGAGRHPCVSFLELPSFRILAVDLVTASVLASSGAWFEPPVWSNVVPEPDGRAPAPLRISAVPGGDAFGIWGLATPKPTALQPGALVLFVDRGAVTCVNATDRGSSQGRPNYAIPCNDRGSVATLAKGMLAGRGIEDLGAKAGSASPEAPVVPSGHPAFLFSLRGGGVVGLLSAIDGSRLGLITDLVELAGFPGEDAYVIDDSITPEKRIQLLPAAKLLVTIPLSNDRVVLRRLDLESALSEIVGDDVLIASPPSLVVRSGERLTYRLHAFTKRGPARFSLSQGPEGLRVSSEGDLQWSVPASLQFQEVKVIIAASVPSGASTSQALTIRVR